MARYRLIPLVIIPWTAQSSFAQGWTTYRNLEDRFSVNLPGEPEVREITYPSEFGAVLPGRIYTYEDGLNHYSVTVIDYTEAERIHAEHTNKTLADSLDWYWQIDVQASIAWQFRQRDADVTDDVWHNTDLVEGHQL